MRLLLPTVLPLLLAIVGCDDEPATPTTSATPASGPVADPLSDLRAEEQQLPPGHPPVDSPTPSQGTPTGGTPSGTVGAQAAGGLRWNAPEPFRQVPPASGMRAAEYLLPAGDGDAGATMTVFFFGEGQGGSVQDNMDRWISQFSQPDGSPSRERATIEEKEVNSLRVTTVDLTGTFATSPMMGGSGEPETNQRMLGAIIEGPQGPVFFKLVGDAALLERAVGPFQELVESVQPQ
jgi:hypothetical protein